MRDHDEDDYMSDVEREAKHEAMDSDEGIDPGKWKWANPAALEDN